MAITLVQSAISSAPDTDTISLAFPSPVTAGNLLLVMYANSAANDLPASDTLGNSYTDLFPGGTASFSYAIAASSGACTVSLGPSFGASWCIVAIAEYSGIDTASPLDQKSAHSDTAATVQPGAITTTAANELVVAVGVSNSSASGTPTWAIDSGFAIEKQKNETSVFNPTFIGSLMFADLLLSSTATENPTLSGLPTPVASTALIASFRGAAPAVTAAIDLQTFDDQIRGAPVIAANEQGVIMAVHTLDNHTLNEHFQYLHCPDIVTFTGWALKPIWFWELDTVIPTNLLSAFGANNMWLSFDTMHFCCGRAWLSIVARTTAGAGFQQLYIGVIEWGLVP